MHSPAAAQGHPVKRAPMRALVSWVLFDWAAQPYYTLVLTFLFAPFFATVVVGNAAHGQTLWGYAAAAAGILIAIGSPLLGAFADGRGRRKPWIALFSLLLIAGLASLWMAKPCADNMMGRPGGTSATSSTNTTPRSSKRRTTIWLCTISW